MKNKYSGLLVLLMASSLLSAAVLPSFATGTACNKTKSASTAMGKMNDDVYVEITAYASYYSGKFLGNPKGLKAAMDPIYKKYGVDRMQYASYGFDLMKKDQVRFNKLANKAMARKTEIIKQGK